MGSRIYRKEECILLMSLSGLRNEPQKGTSTKCLPSVVSVSGWWLLHIHGFLKPKQGGFKQSVFKTKADLFVHLIYMCLHGFREPARLDLDINLTLKNQIKSTLYNNKIKPLTSFLFSGLDVIKASRLFHVTNSRLFPMCLFLKFWTTAREPSVMRWFPHGAHFLSHIRCVRFIVGPSSGFTALHVPSINEQ